VRHLSAIAAFVACGAIASAAAAQDADGTTPLHWAAHQNDLAAVQRLIREGANVNAKNDYGATPMSEAALTGNAALLEALLKAGANPESPNADGQTALWWSPGPAASRPPAC
jgi:ankyrin repeat protein